MSSPASDGIVHCSTAAFSFCLSTADVYPLSISTISIAPIVPEAHGEGKVSVEGGGGYGTILLQVCWYNTARALPSRGRQALKKGNVCVTMTSNSSGTLSVPLPGSRLAGLPKCRSSRVTRSIGGLSRC